jgi:glutamate-5-semialdehyde dehydrogenase
MTVFPSTVPVLSAAPGVSVRVLAEQARAAARTLAIATAQQKNHALRRAAAALRTIAPEILAANARDMATAQGAGRPAAYLDRLHLTPIRIDAIAASLEEIAAQPDPVGLILEDWQRPNGLHLQKISVPIGVIGIIFEARPNVTADAGALCLKSGNAAVLRCGGDSLASSLAILECLHVGLRAAELPVTAVQLVPTAGREAVGEMLGLVGLIDVIIPRGGKSLTARVAAESRVPVLKHLDGICHIYVDAAADAAKAVPVVQNAKLRRTGVCGALETLLLHHSICDTIGRAVVADLIAAGCEVRGDETVQALHPQVQPASEDDWRTEYLAPILAVKAVDSLDAAIAHINQYGSHHTDAILTEDVAVAGRFLAEVDSAIVMHNTSTQFADGGEFGFGAEIGISTDRLHARGPVGARHLTTFKYCVRSDGAIRPV